MSESKLPSQTKTLDKKTWLKISMDFVSSFVLNISEFSYLSVVTSNCKVKSLSVTMVQNENFYLLKDFVSFVFLVNFVNFWFVLNFFKELFLNSNAVWWRVIWCQLIKQIIKEKIKQIIKRIITSLLCMFKCGIISLPSGNYRLSHYYYKQHKSYSILNILLLFNF